MEAFYDRFPCLRTSLHARLRTHTKLVQRRHVGMTFMSWLIRLFCSLVVAFANREGWNEDAKFEWEEPGWTGGRYIAIFSSSAA